MRNILIVDDHQLFLEGMRFLLKKLAVDVEICICTRAQCAIDMFDRGDRFSFILIDLEMPGLDGFALLHALSERRISSPVAVISANLQPATIRRAMRSGALGFIPKHADSNTMLSGLKTILKGDIYLPDEIWSLIGDEPIFTNKSEEKSETADHSDIGSRQKEVLELMTRGLTNKQIASVLSIQEATVKYHIGILFRVLGVKSRTACIREAQRKEIITPELS